MNLLPDFESGLIIGVEEVVGAVILDGLPAVLPNIEHYEYRLKQIWERRRVRELETRVDAAW